MEERLGIDENRGLDWDRFTLDNNGSFLQSWEWGEFQKSVGRRTHYLKGDEYQTIIVKHNLPLGKSYLYCPKGSVISSRLKVQSSELQSTIQKFLEEIKNLAKQEDAIFVRIEPTFEIGEQELKKAGFIKSKDVQPSKTLILDLSQGEQEIFSNFHPKTRYNINLAGRKGVIVKNFQFPIPNDQFENFWRLMKETAQRQKIRIFPEDYYENQLQIKSNQFENLLFIAEYQGKAIASNMVNLFGQTATYLHGGSDNEYRSFMAPHFLQWEQIKEAKRKGCKFYDFWGIDEINWPGITRFKKGFGGKEINYMGTFDFIFEPIWYRFYNLARRIF